MSTTDDTANASAAGQSTPRRVHIVPHTHWDREWYEPFHVFRLSPDPPASS